MDNERYSFRKKEEPVWKTIADKDKARIRNTKQGTSNKERIEKHEATRGVKAKMAKKMK